MIRSIRGSSRFRPRFAALESADVLWPSRQATSAQPVFFSTAAKVASPSAIDMAFHIANMPLLPEALLKKGQLAAFTTWLAVEPAPALQPSIMTLLLSPPKAAMFSETHCRARRWSCRP